MNKRVVMVGLIGMTFFLLAHRPAFAMSEFCPARLQYQAVGQSADSTAPSAMYGFELTALGPRTITSATVAFDTAQGWYTIEVPRTSLVKKDRHYSSPIVSYIHHDYVSPVLYVRFPGAVRIAHAWVFQVTARDDTFGWQAQGPVTCDPPAAPSAEQLRQSKARRSDRDNLDPVIDPKDRDDLSASPNALSVILAAQASNALETANCAVPFQEAAVKNQAVAQYPDIIVTSAAKTSVQVAIQPDGTLGDAWVWAPSGVAAFDAESLSVAKQSTYTGARAYCQPVPGVYFFDVTFDPN